MPKAATTSSVQSTPNSSPRKATRRTRSDPVEIDKSKWRASRISVGTTINKSAATANYHLNVKDIEGLKYHKTETVVRDVVRTMFLYQERDVEEKAWEKYGSPEAFEQILNVKRAKYYNRHGRNPEKPFPEPASYAEPMTSVMIVAAGSIFREADERRYDAATPKLLAMKQKLQREGKEWLWNAIIDAYKERDGHPGKLEQEWTILPAQTLASRYPHRLRDDSVMSDSTSFVDLREVLSRAPVWGENAEGDFEITTFTFPDIEESPDWTRAYCNEVYDALSDIIAEHGPRGWRQARWLVYDRHAECNLGCVGYQRDRGDYVWGDESNIWLHASEYDKMEKEKKTAFLISLGQNPV